MDLTEALALLAQHGGSHVGFCLSCEQVVEFDSDLRFRTHDISPFMRAVCPGSGAVGASVQVKCTTCNVLLNVVNGTYVHGVPPRDGHQATPTVDIDVTGDALCDFCGEANPAWIYACRSFRLDVIAINPTSGESLVIDEGSHDDWAACETCKTLIEAGNWSEVADRSIDTYLKANNFTGAVAEQHRREYLPAAAAMHAQFRHHRIGDPQPLEKR